MRRVNLARSLTAMQQESEILFFPLSAGTYFLLVAGCLCFSHDEFFESVYFLKVK
jgi:hypothetical protein